MAPISARERRVRELVENTLRHLRLPRASSYNQGIEVGANSVANVLLDEIDSLTKSFNDALLDMSRAAKRKERGK